MAKRVNKTSRKLKKYWVFYDKRRVDCYTIIFENGDMWGCSIKASDPAGYAGNIIETGNADSTKEFIKEMRENSTRLGYEVYEPHLPEDIKEYINQLIEAHYGTKEQE